MAAGSRKCGSVRRKKWRLVLGSADLYVGIVLLKWLGKLDLSVAFTRVLGMKCSRAAALTRIGVCVCVQTHTHTYSFWSQVRSQITLEELL